MLEAKQNAPNGQGSQEFKQQAIGHGGAKLGKIHLPHLYVIIFSLIVLAAIMSYVIPAGQFDREQVEVGGVKRSLVIPGTFKIVESTPVSFLKVMMAPHKGLIAAADVAFLVFMCYSPFYVVLRTGALNSSIAALIRLLRGREWLLIPMFFYVFALGGSMFGMLSEFYGFIPVFIGLAMAMGYDALVGFSLVAFASQIGFAAGTTNPFTVLVAQGVSQLPPLSGLGYRFFCWFVLVTISMLWTLRYAHQVKKDPSKSYMLGIETNALSIDKDNLDQYRMTGRDAGVLLLIVACMGALLYGTLKFEWGTSHITATFLTMAVGSGFICRWGPSRIATELVDGFRNIVFGALVVGLARGILWTLQEGNIIDSLMHYASLPLIGLPSWVAAEGMLVVQSLINFLIPSGSGQAATVMPLMSGLSDILGVSRQVAVLAFQFGDGTTNLLWPTCGIVVQCALGGIPMDRWWRYFIPCFGVLFAAQALLLIIAIMIGYS